MSQKLPNRVVVPTGADRFKYRDHLRQIALLVGAIPIVGSKAEAKQLVQQLQSDSLFSERARFGWLIYVKEDDTIYFHDGSQLREN